MGLPSWIRNTATGAELRLKVQPRASRNEAGPLEGERLRVRVTAPPVDSSANEAVLELMAEWLECRRGAVRILHGGKSREKVLQVEGLSAEEVVKRLRSG